MTTAQFLIATCLMLVVGSAFIISRGIKAEKRQQRERFSQAGQKISAASRNLLRAAGYPA